MIDVRACVRTCVRTCDSTPCGVRGNVCSVQCGWTDSVDGSGHAHNIGEEAGSRYQHFFVSAQGVYKLTGFYLQLKKSSGDKLVLRLSWMAGAKTADDDVVALKALVEELKLQNQEKDEELDDLESNLETALVSIKTFHQQQQELYDNFVELRDKYDKLKNCQKSTLWTWIPKHCKACRTIPSLNKDVEEDDEHVGAFELGKTIGRGQFAVVRTCDFSKREAASNDGEKQLNSPKARATMAVKIITKSKVIDVRDMERISCEIAVLREVTHKNLLRLVDIVHTEEFLYIVTGRGGDDLFEYLSRQQGPLSDMKAHIILRQVLAGVMALHDRGICHRDLKPENILLDVEDNVIVCDYGLCTRVYADTGLSDFCGSPGFFAPEMITSKTYNGFSCDVWSLGCLLLELVVGHSPFSRLWMSSYVVDVLSDADVFVSKINESKIALLRLLDEDEDYKHISQACKDLLQNMLNVNFTERISVADAYTSKWIGGKLEPKTLINSAVGVPAGDKTPSPLRRKNSFGDKLSPMSGLKSPGSSPGSERRRSPLSFGAITTPSDSLGTRRQVSLELNTKMPGGVQTAASPQTVTNRANQLLHLPPIDAPDTPKVTGAKKIKDQGDLLLKDVGLKKTAFNAGNKSSV